MRIFSHFSLMVMDLLCLDPARPLGPLPDVCFTQMIPIVSQDAEPKAECANLPVELWELFDRLLLNGGPVAENIPILKDHSPLNLDGLAKPKPETLRAKYLLL